MREYDCRVCLAEGLYKKRECLLTIINPAAKTEFWCSPPILDGKNTIIRDPNTGKSMVENRRVGEEGFLDILWSLNHKLPDKSSFELWELFFDDICLTAFADMVMFAIIEAESTISEYKGAIGSLYNEENRKSILGFYMEYEDFLEALSIVRRAKRDYERYRYDKMQRENEKK